MGDVSLMLLGTSLFCGILFPGDNAAMITAVLLAGSFVAFSLSVVARRSIRLGIVNALQGLMLAELLLPLTTSTLQHFWGNYLSFVCAAGSFLIWSNLVRWHHRRWISAALAIYALILVGQIALRALEIARQGIPSVSYKAFLIVPFGASNYLGGPLLILFFLFLCIRGQDVPVRLAGVVLAALLVGMLLIRSRAALLSLVCTLLVYTLSRARSVGTRMRVVIWTGIGLLLTAAGFVGAVGLVGRYGGLMIGLNSITSGRILILREALEAFFGHPWFGWGLGHSPAILGTEYNIESWRAHNFIMDLLMFSGMVGTVIQCCVYLLVAHSLRVKAAFSPWATGAFFSLIAILIDGLAEPNVFSYRVDGLLWMVIGIGYALYDAHDNPLAAQSTQEA